MPTKMTTDDEQKFNAAAGGSPAGGSTSTSLKDSWNAYQNQKITPIDTSKFQSQLDAAEKINSNVLKPLDTQLSNLYGTRATAGKLALDKFTLGADKKSSDKLSAARNTATVNQKNLSDMKSRLSTMEQDATDNLAYNAEKLTGIKNKAADTFNKNLNAAQVQGNDLKNYNSAIGDALMKRVKDGEELSDTEARYLGIDLNKYNAWRTNRDNIGKQVGGTPAELLGLVS